MHRKAERRPSREAALNVRTVGSGFTTHTTLRTCIVKLAVAAYATTTRVAYVPAQALLRPVKVLISEDEDEVDGVEKCASRMKKVPTTALIRNSSMSEKTSEMSYMKGCLKLL